MTGEGPEGFGLCYPPNYVAVAPISAVAWRGRVFRFPARVWLFFAGSGACWRGVRVAEGAALEMPCAGNRTGGSNPPLSALFPARGLRVASLEGRRLGAERFRIHNERAQP